MPAISTMSGRTTTIATKNKPGPKRKTSNKTNGSVRTRTSQSILPETETLSQVTAGRHGANKIQELVDAIERLTASYYALEEKTAGYDKRFDVLEGMFDRSFVLMKVQEGNLQKLTRVILETRTRKREDILATTYTVQQLADALGVNRMTISRWCARNENNPEKMLRHNVYEGTDIKYFVVGEVVEDIQMKRIPTNKSKEFLLDNLCDFLGVPKKYFEPEEDSPEAFSDL